MRKKRSSAKTAKEKLARGYEQALADDLVKRGIPRPLVDCHRFHPTRRWRFDLAWPELMIAVEVEGHGKNHHALLGYERDCEKYNEAILLGWILLRFTTRQVRQGVASERIEEVFKPFLC